MTTEELVGRLLVKSRSAIESRLQKMVDERVVARAGRRGEASFRLTRAGRELAGVIDVASAWIEGHPERQLAVASAVGWRAFAALAEHWRSGVIEWVVRAEPTEAELADQIGGITRRQLRGELRRLRAAGLIDARRGPGGAERLRPTDWGRRGIGVLAAAAAWEQRYAALPGGIVVADALVAFLASLPLVRLPADVVALCTLTAMVEPGSVAKPRAGAAWAWVHGGVVECGEGASSAMPDAWVSGSLDAWLDGVVRGRLELLELGGDRELAGILLAQIRTQLYGP